MRKQILIMVAVVALMLTGCASTAFESTWKAPDVSGGELAGKNLVAIALAPKTSRLAAEDAIVNKLGEYSASAKQSYLILDLEASKDELKQKIEAEGFDAAVVMKFVGQEKEIRSTNTGMYMGVGGPYPGGFYGYGWGWGMSYAPEITTDTLISVETLVYSVKADKLVWAGRSTTTNPSKMDAFVGEVLDAAIGEMKKVGLVAEKK